VTDVSGLVQRHYGRGGLLERLFAALRESGVDPDRLTYRDLFPFDQFHGRGIDATREHADAAAIRPGMHVLDLGCGIGGASRYLAAERGCCVTGIDLTPEFVEAAAALTARCGLSARIAFEQADAARLSFSDATFDHVWCHNVTMNIPDKRALAGEVARVLKPGGRFSCAELAQGPAGPPAFPVPWASDPSASFLVTPLEMRAALEAGGLRMLRQLDLTDKYRAAIEENRRRADRGEPPVQRTDVIAGDGFLERIRNSSRGVMEGRLVEHMIIAEKA
jgi:SAM-dependent methyltransferase